MTPVGEELRDHAVVLLVAERASRVDEPPAHGEHAHAVAQDRALQRRVPFDA